MAGGEEASNMSIKQRKALADPEVRRVYEEELLVGEATETIAGLLTSLGIPRKELARRLEVSAGRVSQILSGAENLTLRSLGALGWALGIRFNLRPVAMADRRGTPAEDDPQAPAWLASLSMPRPFFWTDPRPVPQNTLKGELQRRVDPGGQLVPLKAA
jgi:transcriptional regulator with XRE-family HTH domain